MALPGNLSYFLSRMQGVSTNYFKIFPKHWNGHAVKDTAL